MRAHRWVGLGVVLACLGLGLLLGASPAAADEKMDAQQLVERARMTFEAFTADKELGNNLTYFVRRAKGVLIFPQVLRGAFIVGASGGSGVFVAYDETTKHWNGPAFYTLGQGSFGLQIGGDSSEVVLLAMTDRGIAALQATSVKLGADTGVSIGPVGAGASASTANLSVDILSFSRSAGLYVGISLDGAVLATRDALNHWYYGQPVSTTDILVRHTVQNPHAAPLIDAVKKIAER